MQKLSSPIYNLQSTSKHARKKEQLSIAQMRRLKLHRQRMRERSKTKAKLRH